MRSSPPAWVLGAGLTALGTVRSLGAAGIASACLTAEPGEERWSRWYRRDPALPLLQSASDLSQKLSQLPKSMQAVLFPCSDHFARQVAALPPEIKTRFVAPTPSLEVLNRFIDKERFAETLREFDLAAPQTLLLKPGLPLPSDLPPTAFVKPVDSQSFFAKFGVKGFLVQEARELPRVIEQAHQAGHAVILQELIPGPATAHFYIEGYFDSQGALRAVFARRRLRIFPPPLGNSTAMVSIPLSEVAAAHSQIERLLTSLHYRGIFSAEFKHDARDGRAKLIEVNARPWWYIEVPTRCGLNIAEIAYRDLVGAPLANSARSYAIGRTFIHGYTDALARLGTGRLTLAGLIRWVRDWCLARFVVFRWTDPLPATMWFLQTTKAAIWRRLKVES